MHADTDSSLEAVTVLTDLAHWSARWVFIFNSEACFTTCVCCPAKGYDRAPLPQGAPTLRT